MFNKRESSPTPEAESQVADMPRRESAPSTPASSRGSAIIGPSIRIDGTLRGDEDLQIEGKVKGTVELKKNSVTIGARGEVTADIYANIIFVDGKIEGNLFAAERVVIRKNAHVRGSIASPRVSLEDGASFNGSIDMDPETDALKKAFGKNVASHQRTPVATAAPESQSGGSSSGSASSSDTGKQNQQAKSRA